jgi:hypothetical protein
MAIAGGPTFHERKMVTLLTALVLLVGVLVVGLAAGAAVAARAYARLNASVEKVLGQQGGELEGVATQARQVLGELGARQAQTAEGLERVAKTSEARIAKLEARAQTLGGIEKGPMDKMAQMIELQQVMVQEMLVMLKHFAGAHGTMANAMRPLSAQQPPDAAPAPPGAGDEGGVGGSGHGASRGR